MTDNGISGRKLARSKFHDDFFPFFVVNTITIPRYHITRYVITISIAIIVIYLAYNSHFIYNDVVLWLIIMFFSDIVLYRVVKLKANSQDRVASSTYKLNHLLSLRY